MLGIHDYWLFIASGILLNLTPGQDTMYILGRSLGGGLRVGVASALGITLGSVCHTVAAAAGLSLLLATSPLAFTLVKLAGGAYLIFLGGRLLFARDSNRLSADSKVESAQGGTGRAFAQGILTNVLNPKVALFFLAFLPQFITPASPSKTLAFLALGATFITTGTIWCLVLALAAAQLRRFLGGNRWAPALIDRATGGLFLLLGARLAWSR